MNSININHQTIDTVFGFFEQSVYYFLSNLYPCEVKIDGYTFKSAESAYEALIMKECGYDDNYVRTYESLDALSARKKTREIIFEYEIIIPSDVKINVMKNVVSCKFAQHPELKDRLCATVGKKLIAYNDINEIFFGVVYNPAASTFTGQNQLGIILEELRDRYRSQA